MESSPRLVDSKNGHCLYRGPRPDSLEDLKALNCQTIIDLESGLFEFLNDRAYEEDGWAGQSGVKIRHLPLSDIFPPTDFEIRAFISMVGRGLDRGSVYVHCLHGVDRTGFMCAAYRILLQGWSPVDAINEMLALGFHKFPYWFWIRKLKYL